MELYLWYLLSLTAFGISNTTNVTQILPDCGILKGRKILYHTWRKSYSESDLVSETPNKYLAFTDKAKFVRCQAKLSINFSTQHGNKTNVTFYETTVSKHTRFSQNVPENEIFGGKTGESMGESI